MLHLTPTSPQRRRPRATTGPFTYTLALIVFMLGGCREGREKMPPPEDVPKTPIAETPAPTPPDEKREEPRYRVDEILDAPTQALLQQWYAAVGAPEADESYGAFIARIALLQLGKPYYNAPETQQPELMRITMDSFQCVSFVEQSVALARCLWLGEASAACFVREVERQRYRSGEITDYASRLHYFSDWLADNAARGLLKPLSDDLGGKKHHVALSYMSDHPELYPMLSEGDTLAQIASVEKRLSETPMLYIERDDVAAAQGALLDGDIIAFVGAKKGLLVTHAGFVQTSRKGVKRVLHASSHHQRVLLTRYDLATYVTNRPERRGIIVVRPLAPNRTKNARSGPPN